MFLALAQSPRGRGYTSCLLQKQGDGHCSTDWSIPQLSKACLKICCGFCLLGSPTFSTRLPSLLHLHTQDPRWDFDGVQGLVLRRRAGSLSGYMVLWCHCMMKDSWPVQCTNASFLQTGTLLMMLGCHVLFSSSAPSQRLLSEFRHFSLMNGPVLKLHLVRADRSYGF